MTLDHYLRLTNYESELEALEHDFGAYVSDLKFNEDNSVRAYRLAAEAIYTLKEVLDEQV